MSREDPVVIVAAARTAIGHFNGYFASMPSPILASHAITGALSKSGIKLDQIEEVIMGCILPAGLGQAPARQAALKAFLPNNVACTTINKMCGSGMKAVMMAHDTIVANSSKVIVAGGMENMTRAPYLLNKARFGYRLGNAEIFDHMVLDGLQDAYQPECVMGNFAEESAKEWHFDRKAQDDYALISLSRAQHATKTGQFRDEIVPIKVKDIVIEIDEGPATLKADKISKLSPVFSKNGTITAANASSISDGAAVLILMRRSYAKHIGAPIFATILGHSSYAHLPSHFPSAPVAAIEKLLAKINWKTTDADLYEINEAFAVVPLIAMKALNLPIEKVNVNGGACVLGHPVGASGARILVTLLYALAQRQLKKGIAAICIGGGEATAIAIELEK